MVQYSTAHQRADAGSRLWYRFGAEAQLCAGPKRALRLQLKHFRAARQSLPGWPRSRLGITALNWLRLAAQELRQRIDAAAHGRCVCASQPRTRRAFHIIEALRITEHQLPGAGPPLRQALCREP